jgi:hypothetical protein
MLMAGEVTVLRRSAPAPRSSFHARSAAGCVPVCGAARHHRQRVRPQRSSETLAPHAAAPQAPSAPLPALVEEQRLRLELALAVETMGERVVDPQLLRSTPKQRCVALTTGGSWKCPSFPPPARPLNRCDLPRPRSQCHCLRLVAPARGLGRRGGAAGGWRGLPARCGGSGRAGRLPGGRPGQRRVPLLRRQLRCVTLAPTAVSPPKAWWAQFWFCAVGGHVSSAI